MPRLSSNPPPFCSKFQSLGPCYVLRAAAGLVFDQSRNMRDKRGASYVMQLRPKHPEPPACSSPASPTPLHPAAERATAGGKGGRRRQGRRGRDRPTAGDERRREGRGDEGDTPGALQPSSRPTRILVPTVGPSSK